MTLTAGSIAFIGFNADGTDGFAFIAIDPIPAGTVIRFQDNEWNGLGIGSGGAFNTGEGSFTWTNGSSDLPPGTVVEFLNVSSASTRIANIGTFSGGTTALGNSGESIFAFVGTSETSPTTFLAAITNNNGGFNGATTSGLLGGTGLTAGLTALVLPGTGGADVAAYNPTLGGSTFATRTAALTAFNTASNWVAQDDSGNQDADDITPDAPFLTDPQSPIAGVTFTIGAPTPVVTIVAQDAAAAEAGQDPGTFRITRTGSTANALTVSYTIGGTTSTSDYTPALAGTVTIPVGASFVDITITPVDDALVEGDETVILTLVDTADYDLGATTSATVTIADNDVAAVGNMQITEYMYQGANGEFIEFTNIGNAPVDLTGWSFDDNSRISGSFDLSAFGIVQPGESVILTEATAAAFRAAWSLPNSVKVIGGLAGGNNLGRNDEINLYDASNNLVDRLTYGDETIPGTIRTQSRSGWAPVNQLADQTIDADWVLSTVNDAQNSRTSTGGDIGNPGNFNAGTAGVLLIQSGASTDVAEGGATDTYTIVLRSQPTADVTVTINPGSQVTTNTTTLIFTPANWNVAQTVTVTAVDDVVVEGAHIGTIAHTVTSSDANYNGIGVTSVTANITDNDFASIAPTIVEATATPFLDLPATGSGFASGVISDPTDPAKALGIDFTIADADTPVDNLVVTVSSSNSAVVPNANLTLTGTGATRNLKIDPIGVGFANITVTVNDGTNTNSYVIQYAASAASGTPTTSRFHTGASDASTAIALDADYMLVADDEDQTIRLYDRNDSGLPLASFDFTSLLGLSGSSEVDIEASTRLGNTIYWLGSHSNNSSGNDRPNRERLFATEISGTGASTNLTFTGYYQFLEDDLIAWDNANGHGLGAGFLGLAASAANGVLPEQTNGFNIEGLTVSPSGTTAYLAFRAPNQPTSSRTQALIIPVTNFTSLLSPTGGTTGSATFGAPIQLDLGGRGIRSIERNGTGEYVIIAGPAGAATGTAPADFRLYTWTGNPTDAPVLRNADLTALNAGGSFEAIVQVPDNLTNTTQLQVLVDNGDTIWYNNGVISKDLESPTFSKTIQKFRSDVITLGDPVVAALPLVTIVAIDSAAAEAGQDPGTFRISRTGATTNALTVSYTIAAGAGQATSGDYTPTLTGTVEIPVGASFVDITITPVDDNDIEGAETVTLNLVDAAAYDLGTSTSATVTIADNDSAPPQLVPGDVIFNEYASDNNANGNDFFELLVLKDGADLRGLRVSDNELLVANGSFNTGESVFVFGNDAFLSNVPRGTTIAVYTSAAGVTTDTVTSPIAGDWSMTLAPGTGVTVSTDGLGGSINTGLSTDGDALYLYLPGADGTSAGTDNQYLDFISYEGDGGAVAPTGLVDLNLTSPADNAYYTGNTAAGNDLAANWVKSAALGAETPGAPNPGQDLSSLRQPKIVINEILASHTGTDNTEFIELFGTPGASLAGLSLIIVESDVIGLGTIDRRIDFTATDVLGSNGFYLIGNPTGLATNYGVTPNRTIGNDFLENNSLTAALVKTSSLSGTSVTGNEEVVDTVGITDGGTGDSFFFNAPVIGPDGTFFPAGVRRVTDGVDTDTVADWVISDFNLGAANTPTPGLSAGVTIVQSGGNTSVTEGGATDTYTIVLNSQPTANVTITITPDAQVTTSTTSLVFTPANWNVAQTVTVIAIDDAAIEGNHTGSITHSATSTDAAYNGVIIPTVTANITDNDAAAAITKIHQIQGNAATQLTGGVHNDVSPLNGQSVTIEGVVTADFQLTSQLRGFFIQEETTDQDGDGTTSEGIFVFTGNTPPLDVQEGQKVRVTGVVNEFFGMTQLTATTAGSITLIDGGNNLGLITPAAIALPATGDLDDYYEQFEGMKVQFSDKLVVSEYFELARYGQLVLTKDARPFQYSHIDNTPTAAEYSAFLDSLNRSRIILDDDNNTQNAPLPSGVFPYPQPGGLSIGTQGTNYFRGGDSITGLTGVLHWSFAGQSGTDAWRIRPTQANPISFTVENPRPITPPDVGGNVKVASFNVLNYFTTIDTVGGSNSPRGADSQDELDRQTEKLVQALKGLNADVFGLIELENNGDAANGGAIKAVVDALNAEVGANTYNFINTGKVGTDAITVGFIYKQGVVAPKGNVAVLDTPSFTDPNNTGQQRNRPAIAQTFEVINPSNDDFGEAFNVVVNHLKSKGSGTGAAADNDQNDGQGASNDTRTKAAQALAQWLATDPTGQGDADWLIIGDLNAYKGEAPITALKNAGYTDLVEQFGGTNAYSYVFNGQLGYLDYALANAALAPQITGVAEWHINADEVPVFDYNNTIDDGAGEQSFEAKPTGNPLYEPNAFRTSDHDPVLVGLNLFSTPKVNGQPATIYVNDTNTVVGNAFQAGQRPYAGALFSKTDGTTNPNDVILGTSGNDNIWAGTEGNDLINSGAGDDTIGISAGNSTVNAGADNDFVYTTSATSGTNTIDLGEGNNGAWLAVGNNTVTAGSGVDTIGIGSGNNTLNLGGGNDFVYVIDGYTAGTNTIDVGEGDNSIYLPTGNNTITAGTGNDTIGIGTGNDVVNAGDGNNVIYSIGFVADEVNEITTGAGQDNIWVEGGNNTINSGDGNDTIGIGAGNNIVNTNGGNDFVYTFGSVFGTNTINLGSGANTAYLQGGTNTVTAGDGNNSIGLGAGNDTVVLGNGSNLIYLITEGGNPSASTPNGNDTITTGSGDDQVYLGAGNNTINVGNGNNIVFVAGGTNTIIGGSGNDLFFGGVGNDTFIAGTGNNYLFGDAGSDVFGLVVGGFAQVADFQVGIDKLGLTGGLTAANLTLFQDAANTLVITGGNVIAQLNGIQATSITTADFQVL